MQDPQNTGSNRVDPVSTISFSELASSTRLYLPALLLTLAAVALTYMLYAVVTMLSSPVDRNTGLAFRAEFEGAGAGKYPNDLKFNPSDIVSVNILRKVYAANHLERFVSFTAFKNSVFITESNAALEMIDREYQAKFADPKITTVDRDRLEAEYQLKRDSLSHVQFAINYTTGGDDKLRLPPTLIEKVMRDTLRFWAEDQTENKGALRYRFPIITVNGVDQKLLQNAEPVLQLEILRTKINMALRSVNDFLELPGAELIRTPENKWSLTDIRARLQDLVRFRIQPLQSLIIENNYILQPQSVKYFLDSQNEYVARELTHLKGASEALRNAILLYEGENGNSNSSPSNIRSPQSEADQPKEFQSATPMLTDAFLDRLVTLTSESGDRQYRQKNVNDYRDMSLAILPMEQELTYYGQLRARLNASGTGGTASQEVRDSIAAQQKEVLERFAENLRAIESAYLQLSQSQNSSASMYTVTGGIVQRTERTVSIPKLILNGLLALLLTLPLFAAGAFIHYRLRREASVQALT